MSAESNPEPVASLDGGNDEGNIKLISSDSREFTLAKKHAFISVVVKTGVENDPSATELNVPSVKGEVLAIVVQYMEHHKGTEPPIVEKPLRSKIMKDVVKDPWDAELLDKIGENRQLLYDLTLAANYLDIKSLMHLGCAKVASLIKGQPLEKIRDILVKGTKFEGTPAPTPATAAKKDEKA